MHKHEDKVCPRCGQPFECRVGDILKCQCYGIEMNVEIQDHIAKQYNECLCRKCLLELKTAQCAQQATPGIQQP